MAAGGPIAALIGLAVFASASPYCPTTDSNPSCVPNVHQQHGGLALALTGAVVMVIGIVILATTPKTGVQAPGGPARGHAPWGAPSAYPRQAIPAGWYPYPSRPGMLRWWDGYTWGPESPIPPSGQPGGFGSNPVPGPDGSPPGPPQ
jgi:hypothetical protein